MDKKKALYRAKLNAQKTNTRIDSPLVRYNESDQPVCRVCDIVLKSESLWPAHQVSRKHQEAVKNLKDNAARVNNARVESSKGLPKTKPEHPIESHDNKPESVTGLPKTRPSSVLPSDFFDSNETKRQNSGGAVAKSGNRDSQNKVQGSVQTHVARAFDSENKIDASLNAKSVGTKSNEFQPLWGSEQIPEVIVESETKQAKGALPEGFFDDKNADLRARGVTPVKLDVKDEYKEFEKLIQEDLKEVDNRMEEEEYDAAETIEEAESVEQKAYIERVEMLKRKKMELKDARSNHSRGPKVVVKETSDKESSSDEDSDEDFTVDWRAKHL